MARTEHSMSDEAKARTPTAEELIQASRDAAGCMTAEARYAAVSRAAEELLNIADGFTGDPRHHSYELGKVARAMKADIAEQAVSGAAAKAKDVT